MSYGLKFLNRDGMVLDPCQKVHLIFVKKAKGPEWSVVAWWVVNGFSKKVLILSEKVI